MSATAGDARDQRARRRDLFSGGGLNPDAPYEVKMLSAAVFFNVLEKIARDYTDGRAIGIRVGASMRCDDYGAFGLAFKSAIDLAGSTRWKEPVGW